MFVVATLSAGSPALDVVVLFLVVVAFAWNLGVHYTGAVMGMPYAAQAIALWPALVLIGIFTILGATFASGPVEKTVGQHIISDRFVSVPDAIVIVLAAGALTMLYNYYKIPTSTIQILVFCIIGVGLAGHIPIVWSTIWHLAIVWVSAPVAACLLGYLFTRALDLLIPPRAAQAQAREQVTSRSAQLTRELVPLANGAAGHEHLPITAAPAAPPNGWRTQLVAWFPGAARPLAPAVIAAVRAEAGNALDTTLLVVRLLPVLLVTVGMGASFVLGANDVSNATGAFILTHLFPLTLAGLIGGAAMAIGALTWGRRILHTVAFDVVKMDLTMASAAQGVQALVVLVAVTQGFFTSMNQALIGAMAGTGLARGRETVQRKQMLGILRGWLIGPLSGLALAYALEWVARLVLR